MTIGKHGVALVSKRIRDEKQEEELNRLKLLGVSIEVINDNKKKVRYKRVYNKKSTKI